MADPSFSWHPLQRSRIAMCAPVVIALTCVTLAAFTGQARGEVRRSESKIVIRKPVAAKLQQPAFIVPLPGNPRDKVLPGTDRATAKTDAVNEQNEATSIDGDVVQTAYIEDDSKPVPKITLRQPANATQTGPAKKSDRPKPTSSALTKSEATKSTTAKTPASATPVDSAAYAQLSQLNLKPPARPANFQTPDESPRTAPETLPTPPSNVTDPCAALANRPFSEFGISIAMPDGEVPTDFATGCWEPINNAAGPFAGYRAWATSAFAFDATCLCYRPLYFEEANLERYGYGCCEALQPAASAAHFFGTIPALPYCMAVDCPGECIYTLGHYRPGSCNPKRYMWPPCSPRAILAEGGVWTGLIFLIP